MQTHEIESQTVRKPRGVECASQTNQRRIQSISTNDCAAQTKSALKTVAVHVQTKGEGIENGTEQRKLEWILNYQIIKFLIPW